MPIRSTRGVVSLLISGALTGVVGTSGCGSEPPVGGNGTSFSQVPPGCETPQDGCPCDAARVVACGYVTATYGDYVTCSEGKRACDGSKWGPCVGDTIVQQSISGGSGGLHLSNVGGPSSVCPPGSDPCDPYCNQAADDPTTGFTPPAGFTTGPGGMTISQTGATACTALTITAPTTTLVVNNFTGPVVSPMNPLPLTASVTGCTLTTPFPTTWTIDQLDQATISGTTNNTGSLSLVSPNAGKIRVTAYAAGLSNYLDITVKVNILDLVGLAPDGATSAASAGDFYAGGVALVTATPNPGTTPSTATWLYPYAATYLPLGLLAPVVQYKYAVAPSAGDAVQMTMRYPAGSTAATASFNYAILVSESTPDPRVYIPQIAWQRFEQTARGNDATLAIQRWTGSALENETTENIHLVDGQLKGTVYYNSYNSVIGGSTSANVHGSVLAINPNSSTPTAFGGTGGACTVCHTVSSNGSTLITDSMGCPGGTANRDDHCSFAMPGATNIATYAQNTPNKHKFTWGAPYPDGTFYLANAYDNVGGWNGTSQLFKVSNATTIASTNAPANAVTPAFSPDGSELVYNAGVSAGTQDDTGTTLKVNSFNNTTKTFSASATTVDSVLAGYPSFLPDNAGIVYQKVTRAASTTTSHGSAAGGASRLNTWQGGLGEIWLGSTSGSGSFAPTRLDHLNGYNAGTNYLPTVPRTVSPPATYDSNWHSAAGGVTSAGASPGWVYDKCAYTGAAPASGLVFGVVYEDQLNYMPTVAPQEAGGMYWVIFTSRRLYGNIAISSPWQAERSDGANFYANFAAGKPCVALNQYGPNSGFIETKKLWVAAIDTSYASGTDPSHPAFYLPGQELAAGNSRGYWVGAACGAVGASCQTDDDCCGGSGGSPTTGCKITAPGSPPTKACENLGSCVSSGNVCSTAGSPGDCCTGLTCPGAGGKCFNALTGVYTTQTYTREYVATCPAGTRVAWRFFEWQSTIPASTSVDFTAQTKELAGDSYLPVPGVAIGSASATTPASTWAHGPITVDAALTATPTPALVSRPYLLVSMKFNPSADGSQAPTLIGWQQIYDCMPSE